MSKLQDFKSIALSDGISKTNRFYVELYPPRLINNNIEPFTSKLKMIRMMCDTAQLPGVNLSTTPMRTFGESVEVPYEKLFDQVSLTFYVDKQMYVKKLFDSWIESIQGLDRIINYPADYKADMTIYVFDTQENSYYNVKLYEAFPKTIGAISLDYSARDIMKLNVTFSYRYYETSASKPAAAGATVIREIPEMQFDEASYFNTIQEKATPWMPTMTSTNPLGIETYGDDFYVGGA